MNKQILILLVVGLMIFPLVSADVIIPTVTKVYFEQNGQAYNGKIDFTVKGYGYSYPVGPPVEKQEGTYTPKVVFSFSSTYNNYGDKIYENYYMNYRHIDYFELEGKTADGKTFVIKNIDSIPTNCSNGGNYDIMINDKYYRETNEYKSCTNELRNYVPTYGSASNEKVGATRKDNDGNTWTKQADGMWSSPVHPETKWGDIVVDEQKGGVAYASRSGAYEECDKYLQEIPESEIEKDDSGHAIEQTCEIRLNLDNAAWGNPTPNPSKGFWESISCFFKKLFGKSC
jgi:hypothetical protein